MGDRISEHCGQKLRGKVARDSHFGTKSQRNWDINSDLLQIFRRAMGFIFGAFHLANLSSSVAHNRNLGRRDAAFTLSSAGLTQRQGAVGDMVQPAGLTSRFVRRNTL